MFLLVFLFFYNFNISCSNFSSSDDYFDTILSFYIAPDEPKKALVPKKKENSNEWIKEEQTVISIPMIAKFCVLKLICKNFQTRIQPHINNLLNNFPFVCCDNNIMPCVPFASKKPVACIQLTAPQEYDIFLNLYFKTEFNKAKKDYRNEDDYLYLGWHYNILFKENSVIKSILDSYLDKDNIAYELCGYTQISGAPRQDIDMIMALMIDMQKEPDINKHYKCFTKHAENFSFDFDPKKNALQFFLKCLYKSNNINKQTIFGIPSNNTIFPSGPFIQKPLIHIIIPDSLNTFSLQRLKNRLSWHFSPIENHSVICPLLMKNIISLKKIITKLTTHDSQCFPIQLIKKFVEKNSCIKYFLDQCTMFTFFLKQFQKDEITECVNNLNKQHEPFLNCLFEKIIPKDQHNLIVDWISKETYLSIHYLMKNKSILKADLELITEKMLKIIQIILHTVRSTQNTIPTQLQKLALYTQKEMYYLYKNEWNQTKQFNPYAENAGKFLFTLMEKNYEIKINKLKKYDLDVMNVSATQCRQETYTLIAHLINKSKQNNNHITESSIRYKISNSIQKEQQSNVPEQVSKTANPEPIKHNYIMIPDTECDQKVQEAILKSPSNSFVPHLLILHHDCISKILLLTIESKKTSIEQYDYDRLTLKDPDYKTKHADVDIEVIGLNSLADLKKLRLVCKQFQTYADTLLSVFPFICCDSRIMPRISLTPQNPIARITLSALNEYDIFLTLHFTTNLKEDRANCKDYLSLYWKIKIDFKQNSHLKKIFDKLPNIGLSSTTHMAGPGSSARLWYLTAVEKLSADIKKEADPTKHYSFFQEQCKYMFLGCMLVSYSDKKIHHTQSYSWQTIFPSNLFIKSSSLSIPIADPFIIFPLHALKNKIKYLDFSLIQPILQKNMYLLEEYNQQLNASLVPSLNIVQTCIEQINLIQYFLNKSIYNTAHNNVIPSPSIDFDTLSNNLEQQTTAFFDILSTKISPNNQIETWLWKQTCKSIQYLLGINKVPISADTLFTTIRVIMHAKNSKKIIISPEFLQILLYSQHNILKLFDDVDNEASSNKIVISKDEQDIVKKLKFFFHYGNIDHNYTIQNNFAEQLLVVSSLLPKECKKTTELLTLRLRQKQAASQLFSKYHEERKKIVDTQNNKNTWSLSQTITLKKLIIVCLLFFLLPPLIYNLKAFPTLIDNFKDHHDYYCTFWLQFFKGITRTV